jgi:hypothetical protein
VNTVTIFGLEKRRKYSQIIDDDTMLTILRVNNFLDAFYLHIWLGNSVKECVGSHY